MAQLCWAWRISPSAITFSPVSLRFRRPLTPSSGCMSSGSRKTSVSASLLALCIVAAGLAFVPPSTASAAALQVQSQQTSWDVDDDPTLLGTATSWYQGQVNHGYGSNDYRWTYAAGGAATTDNWARWVFSARIGRQEIQAYIPSRDATATVTYSITIDPWNAIRIVTAQVAQADESGWVTLGTWDTIAKDVFVIVRDNEAVQHHSSHGLANSKIGVDAVRMRCVSRCTEISQLSRVTGVTYDSENQRVLWSPVNGATAYDIEWRQSGEGHVRSFASCAAFDGTLFGSKCGIGITPVPSKALEYRVRAKNNSGLNFGPYSNWQTAEPATTIQSNPPSSQVSGLRYSSSRIIWQPLSDAISYIVQWRYDGGIITRNTVTCSSSCSLNISRHRQQDLEFRVRGQNDAGSGTLDTMAH